MTQDTVRRDLSHKERWISRETIWITYSSQDELLSPVGESADRIAGRSEVISHPPFPAEHDVYFSRFSGTAAPVITVLIVIG
jgi:hypothetical protein